MNKVDVSTLREAQVTLLMPLWARAVESKRERPLILDERAAKLVDSLDFDFQQFERKRVAATDYCIRAAVIDQVVKRFLAAHPTGSVIELGVGLDTRFDRLDNEIAHWYEVDLPGAMQLRRDFFPPQDRRTMIAGSLLESTWLDELATSVSPPLLFVAEGVLYFFRKSQVRDLLRRLADRFERGAIVFDAQSPLFLWYSNLRHPLDDSRLEFALGRADEIERWDDRLQVEEYIGFGDSPEYDPLMRRVSPLRRWGRRLFPPIRHFFKIVKVRWSTRT